MLKKHEQILAEMDREIDRLRAEKLRWTNSIPRLKSSFKSFVDKTAVEQNAIEEERSVCVNRANLLKKQLADVLRQKRNALTKLGDLDFRISLLEEDVEELEQQKMEAHEMLMERQTSYQQKLRVKQKAIGVLEDLRGKIDSQIANVCADVNDLTASAQKLTSEQSTVIKRCNAGSRNLNKAFTNWISLYPVLSCWLNYSSQKSSLSHAKADARAHQTAQNVLAQFATFHERYVREYLSRRDRPEEVDLLHPWNALLLHLFQEIEGCQTTISKLGQEIVELEGARCQTRTLVEQLMNCVEVDLEVRRILGEEVACTTSVSAADPTNQQRLIEMIHKVSLPPNEGPESSAAYSADVSWAVANWRNGVTIPDRRSDHLMSWCTEGMFSAEIDQLLEIADLAPVIRVKQNNVFEESDASGWESTQHSRFKSKKKGKLIVVPDESAGMFATTAPRLSMQVGLQCRRAAREIQLTMLQLAQDIMTSEQQRVVSFSTDLVDAADREVPPTAFPAHPSDMFSSLGLISTPPVGAQRPRVSSAGYSSNGRRVRSRQKRRLASEQRNRREGNFKMEVDHSLGLADVLTDCYARLDSIDKLTDVYVDARERLRQLPPLSIPFFEPKVKSEAVHHQEREVPTEAAPPSLQQPKKSPSPRMRNNAEVNPSFSETVAVANALLGRRMSQSNAAGSPIKWNSAPKAPSPLAKENDSNLTPRSHGEDEPSFRKILEEIQADGAQLDAQERCILQLTMRVSSELTSLAVYWQPQLERLKLVASSIQGVDSSSSFVLVISISDLLTALGSNGSFKFGDTPNMSVAKEIAAQLRIERFPVSITKLMMKYACYNRPMLRHVPIAEISGMEDCVSVLTLRDPDNVLVTCAAAVDDKRLLRM